MFILIQCLFGQMPLSSLSLIISVICRSAEWSYSCHMVTWLCDDMSCGWSGFNQLLLVSLGKNSAYWSFPDQMVRHGMLDGLLDATLMVYGWCFWSLQWSFLLLWSVLLLWALHWAPILCHGFYHSSTGPIELKQEHKLNNVCRFHYWLPLFAGMDLTSNTLKE